MGCMPKKSCYTNFSYEVVAPNPSPNKYTVVYVKDYPNATMLKVKYEGCTNYEGTKILVYIGRFRPYGALDPHFSEGVSPMARFKPTYTGEMLAEKFCLSL